MSTFALAWRIAESTAVTLDRPDLITTHPRADRLSRVLSYTRATAAIHTNVLMARIWEPKSPGILIFDEVDGVFLRPCRRVTPSKLGTIATGHNRHSRDVRTSRCATAYPIVMMYLTRGSNILG
jgi:hypothetical protein